MVQSVHLLYDHEIEDLNKKYLAQVLRESLERHEEGVVREALTEIAHVHDIDLTDSEPNVVTVLDPVDEELDIDDVEVVVETEDDSTELEEVEEQESVVSEPVTPAEEEEEEEQISLNEWGLPQSAEDAERSRIRQATTPRRRLDFKDIEE